MTKIGHLELFVRDTVKSREWYVRALGASPVADQGEFQWIELGGLEVLLRPGEGSKAKEYRSTALAPVLYVEDLAEFREMLDEAGIDPTNGDEDECLTFRDPDGHWWQATVAP